MQLGGEHADLRTVRCLLHPDFPLGDGGDRRADSSSFLVMLEEDGLAGVEPALVIEDLPMLDAALDLPTGEVAALL